MFEIAKILFVIMLGICGHMILTGKADGGNQTVDSALIKADSVIHNYYLNEKEIRKAIKKEMRNRKLRKNSTISIQEENVHLPI